jgi:hypothetical protein
MLPLAACGGNGGGTTSEREHVVVSQIKKNTDGKVYFEVDGKPFLYTGAQIRIDVFMNCEGQTIEEIEKYFAATAAMNVNTVQVPIDWRDIEPEKDRYDFRDMGKLLSYAKKYGLKTEFLWFSTNRCGDSHSFHIPDYIWNDEENYPKYQTSHKDSFWYLYGYLGLLVLSNPKLLERETKAVDALLEYVYNWEKSNGETHVLVGMQIHNEPDGVPRWRLSQQQIKKPDGSRLITVNEAWDDVCAALDAVGKAVKNSKYRVVTRVNLIMLQEYSSNWQAYAPRIQALEGIDIVGNDAYTTSIGDTKQYILDLMGGEYKDNFAHTPENRGLYSNTASMLLAVTAMGGGYLIYDLSSPKVVVDQAGEEQDYGVLTPYNYLKPDPETDMKDRPHAPIVRSLLSGLKKAGEPFILADTRDIAAFNVKNILPVNYEENEPQVIKTRKAEFSFATPEEALAFAAVYGNYIVMFSTGPAKLKLSNGTFSGLESGSYDGNVWTKDAGESFTGGTVNLAGGIVYRIKIDSVDGELLSNTLNNIG